SSSAAESHWRRRTLITSLTSNERAELIVGTVRIIRAARGPNPRLAIPAVERRILAAREDCLQILQVSASFEDRLPHLLGSRRAQGIGELQRCVRLRVGDADAESGVRCKELRF